MPAYSYYADYILALTRNVCKGGKSSSGESGEGSESSSATKDKNTFGADKKIIISAKTTAKDDVRTHHISQ